MIGWRWGSTDTLCATRFNEIARMSRTSLWRIEGNPPNGHDRACATVRGFSHRQVLGSRDGVQPYRRHSPSRNSTFERAKPRREMGRHVSQLEAPFSSARLISSALSSWLTRKESAAAFSVPWVSDRTWLLVVRTEARVSPICIACSMILARRLVVNLCASMMHTGRQTMWGRRCPALHAGTEMSGDAQPHWGLLFQ